MLARRSRDRNSEQDTVIAPSVEPRGESMKERGGVQSIERAFTILEEVASHRDGIRLGELSRKVGLHTSTTFHLVKTMLMLGYLRQMPDDKTYRIGTPLFRLAASALDELEMATLAKPILEGLSASTGRDQPHRGARRRRHRGAGAHGRRRPVPDLRSRRRDAAGPLHGDRQDPAGGARAKTQLRGLSVPPPAGAVDAPRPSPTWSCCGARSPPFARAGLPTMMVNTMRRRAASPSRARISPARCGWRSASRAPCGGCPCRHSRKNPASCAQAADSMSAEFGFVPGPAEGAAAACGQTSRRKRPQPLSFSVDSRAARLYYFSQAEKASRNAKSGGAGGRSAIRCR